MNYPYLAAGYYPPSHKKEEWRRDLDNMRAAGIRLVRTAEICCAWDQIEPVKGQFDLEWLDEFFDLCEERDMYILLGTGTACPPYWLRVLYSDIVIVNGSGTPYPNNASYSWACFDHPGFKEEAERYISTIVERYKDRKGLFGYQIHNEVGFPFMPLASGDMDIYCYCSHSVEAFRRWLEKKYIHIDRLNEAYRWNATNERYSSFSQVDAPAAAPTAWSSVTRWLDWRLFWMDNTAAFVKWQDDIIKKFDNKHPTTTNTFFMKSQDPFGVRMGLDQLKIAESVDFFGIDIYPGSGNKAVSKPECSSMCLDMGRTIAEYLGKDFALLETEGGPINGWVMGPDRNVGSPDIWRNLFDAFGHGSKFALFQGYRDWDYQPLQWGGLTDLDGGVTERYHAVKKIHELLCSNDTVFKNRVPRRPKAAILLSKENAIVMQGIGQEKFLLDAYRGIYTAFWQKNIDVDIINTDMLSEETLSSYKLVCMPLMAVMTQNTAHMLERYVYNGGFLLGSPRLGMLDGRGWRNHSIPCSPLDKVFNLSAMEAEANVYPAISYKGKEYRAFWHKEFIQPYSDDTVADALFDDGSAAAVHTSYGKGCAFYIGTHADIGLIRSEDSFLPDYLEQILEIADIKAECNCSDAELNKIFDCHVTDAGREVLLAVTGKAGAGIDELSSSLIFRSGKQLKSVLNIFDGSRLSWQRAAEGEYVFPVTLSTQRANLYLLSLE